MNTNKKIKFFHSIHFKIPFSFILILIATIEIIGAYFVRQIEHQNIQNFETSIQIPQGITSQITQQLYLEKANMKSNIYNSLQDIDNSSISEVQVIDKNGTIVGNSNVNRQSTVGNKTSVAQVKNVMYNNRKITQIVYNKNSGSSYVIIMPLIKTVNDTSNVIGAIYVSSSMEHVYKDINSVIIIFLSASLVAGLLGALIAIFISRAITRPIDEMKKQAIQMSEGDYSGQVRVYSEDELGQLAVAVNNLSIKVEEETGNSESERRRLDSVLSQMSDGVIATNRRGNITIVNEMAQEFLSITEEEALDQSIIDILNIRGEISFQDILEEPESIIIEVNGEDGDLILNADFSLIQRDSGFVSGIVCVLHDVTEQEQIDRERKQFVSNVSHELRTPLTSIRSYVETLNDGAWEDKELAPKFLKVTVEETERMIRMINDLLSLSRMDQGTSKLDLEYVNFNEFFKYILDRFDMMITKDKEHAEEDGTSVKNYSIKRVFTKHDLWVEIDTDKMTQVIDNILNNAIKYSPDGGVITCRLLETNNHVIISINDQGLGIPRKDQGKIFDRFYRVDKARSRKQGGTGLGLSISKEVVEEHKGKIWVNSAEGKGSTFYISLPYDPNEGVGDWDED